MNFTEMATRLGDDRGSASGRGMLPWFGAGDGGTFDSTAFAISDGTSGTLRAISGWHREAHRTSSSARQSEMKPQLLARMTSRQDPRYKMIRDRRARDSCQKHNAQINRKIASRLSVPALSGSGMDSTSFAHCAYRSVL